MSLVTTLQMRLDSNMQMRVIYSLISQQASLKKFVSKRVLDQCYSLDSSFRVTKASITSKTFFLVEVSLRKYFNEEIIRQKKFSRLSFKGSLSCQTRQLFKTEKLKTKSSNISSKVCLKIGSLTTNIGHIS